MLSRPCLLAAAFLLTGMLIVPPGLALAPDRPNSASALLQAHLGPSMNPLPAALRLPWADRAGFDAPHLAEAAQLVPSQDSSVSVVVALWPTDPSFFAPIVGATGLSTDQIRERYAPSPSATTALVGYFASHGLSIVHQWPDGLTLTLQGTASAVGAAFGTTLLDGTLDGKGVRLAATPPQLPEPFQSEIAAVSGLESGVTKFTTSLHPAPLAPVAARTTNLVSASAVHAIYGLNDLYNYSGAPHFATGVGIALVLWGQGYIPSDLNTFFSTDYPSEFPVPRVSYVPVDGAPAASANAANDPSNVTSEMTLDLEWSGSAAPGASLYAVYAPDGPSSNSYSPTDPHLEDAINTAVQGITAPGVSVISMSFGAPDGSDASFQGVVETLFADAQQRGITVLAASGDTGGAAHLRCSGGLGPEYPASSHYVIAVGGTAPILQLSALGDVTGLDSEPAWNRSGGGYSTGYSAPGWQEVGSAAGPIRANGHRGMPDVAGPAADNLFFYNGQAQAGAGTSFSSPMWAGIVAEMNAIRGAPLGFITPRLYAVGQAEASRATGLGLVDITQGGNCLGGAGAGWDTSTGWGSPRGLLLYEDLSGTFVHVALTPTTGSVVPGATFDVAVDVTNVSSHSGIAAANVTFSLQSVKYVGPCGGALALLSVTTDSSGLARTSLTVPGCFLGTSLQLSATVSGGGYFGSNSTTVTVNLLGLAGFLAVIQVFPYNILGFAGILTVAVLVGWRVGERRDHSERRRRGPPRAPAPALGASGAGSPTPPGASGKVVTNGTTAAPSPVPAAVAPSPPAASVARYKRPDPGSTLPRSATAPPLVGQAARSPLVASVKSGPASVRPSRTAAATATAPTSSPASDPGSPPPRLRTCPVCQTVAGPGERMCSSCGALVTPL